MNLQYWPKSINLVLPLSSTTNAFKDVWREMMVEICHGHTVWQSNFVKMLQEGSDLQEVFSLVSVWSVNMVVGSYCFPRYVAALAARAEQDAVRYGLLHNAWDESGAEGHTKRSHFWLAVRLAKLLGLSDYQIGKIKPIEKARAYTNEHYDQCSQGEFGFAFGMLCLIEEFTTPEFTLIREAFKRSCEIGMSKKADDFCREGGEEYFNANIEDDERHREEMPCLVATWLTLGGIDMSDASAVAKGLEPVKEGAKHSSNLRQEFFEDIFCLVKDGGRFTDLF